MAKQKFKRVKQRTRLIQMWHIDPSDQSIERMKSVIDLSEEQDYDEDDIIYIVDDPTPLSFMLWR